VHHEAQQVCVSSLLFNYDSLWLSTNLPVPYPSATEMIPLTWPELANLHPYAPREQAAGYHELFRQMEKYLCEITGGLGARR
jgi:hypothetical protein